MFKYLKDMFAKRAEAKKAAQEQATRPHVSLLAAYRVWSMVSHVEYLEVNVTCVDGMHDDGEVHYYFTKAPSTRTTLSVRRFLDLYRPVMNIGVQYA